MLKGGLKMEKQTNMVESFMVAHREFLASLGKSLELLDKDIAEAALMESQCTDEWCNATESVIDELAKSVYSISEPRWASSKDSKHIVELRHKVHDLYSKYKSIKH